MLLVLSIVAEVVNISTYTTFMESEIHHHIHEVPNPLSSVVIEKFAPVFQ